MDFGEYYSASVLVLNIQPSEFWNMTPREFEVLAAAKSGKVQKVNRIKPEDTARRKEAVKRIERGEFTPLDPVEKEARVDLMRKLGFKING